MATYRTIQATAETHRLTRMMAAHLDAPISEVVAVAVAWLADELDSYETMGCGVERYQAIRAVLNGEEPES